MKHLENQNQKNSAFRKSTRVELSKIFSWLKIKGLSRKTDAEIGLKFSINDGDGVCVVCDKVFLQVNRDSASKHDSSVEHNQKIKINSENNVLLNYVIKKI